MPSPLQLLAGKPNFRKSPNSKKTPRKYKDRDPIFHILQKPPLSLNYKYCNFVVLRHPFIIFTDLTNPKNFDIEKTYEPQH